MYNLSEYRERIHLMTGGCLLLSSGGVIYSVIVINNITDTCCTAQAGLYNYLH